MTDSEYQRDPVWGPMSRPAKASIEPGQPPWKDHIYLAFWDAAHDAYGFFHWNSSPNHNTGKAQATVVLGGVFHDLKEGLPASTDHFRSPSIEHDLRSAVSIAGAQLQASVQLEPRFAPVDYTGHARILPELVPGQPLNHWQQGLRLHGTMTLDGKPHTLDGLGFRTRTWGFRDDSLQFSEYFSLFACFEDFDVSVMKFRQLDGSMRADGALTHRDGHAVRFLDMHVVRDSAGSPLRLALDLENGQTLQLRRARRTATMWCPIGPPEREGPTFCAFDEFIEWETPAGERGFGLNEQGIIRQVC